MTAPVAVSRTGPPFCCFKAASQRYVNFDAVKKQFDLRRCHAWLFQSVKFPRQDGDKRRGSNWKLAAPAWLLAPKCGEFCLPHRACEACGYYNGRQVIAVGVQVEAKKARGRQSSAFLFFLILLRGTLSKGKCCHLGIAGAGAPLAAPQGRQGAAAPVQKVNAATLHFAGGCLTNFHRCAIIKQKIL